MRTVLKIGIFVVVAAIIGGGAYYVKLEKTKRISEAFASPKEGQVYILNNGNIYYGYQIKSIVEDAIYFVPGKIYSNGYNYDKMRETDKFFSGDSVKITKEELKGYYSGNGELSLYDITEVEE